MHPRRPHQPQPGPAPPLRTSDHRHPRWRRGAGRARPRPCLPRPTGPPARRCGSPGRRCRGRRTDRAPPARSRCRRAGPGPPPAPGFRSRAPAGSCLPAGCPARACAGPGRRRPRRRVGSTQPKAGENVATARSVEGRCLAGRAARPQPAAARLSAPTPAPVPPGAGAETREPPARLPRQRPGRPPAR